MKTLIIYAHPEPKSLNGSLKDLAVSTLDKAGHQVKVSDLYEMNWKAAVDSADYGPYASDPFDVAQSSGRAFDAGALTPDVVAEQEKLLWADTIILQFPLWWYTMPAILKGWVDRVSPTTSLTGSVSTVTLSTASDSAKAPSRADVHFCPSLLVGPSRTILPEG
jgi:NAD(P)H dehydrogenase (quinone)